MELLENATQLKLTLIGEFFVGKTSIIGRFVDGTFDSTYSATIGFSFCNKTVKYEDKDFVLHIWDTSGSERHRAVAPNYYRGTDGCLIVYDLTNPQSIDQMEYWYDEFRNVTTTSYDSNLVPVVIIGNKSDLAHDESTEEKANQFAESKGISHHYVVSAKTGEGIEEAFNGLIQACIEFHEAESKATVKSVQPTPESKPCC